MSSQQINNDESMQYQSKLRKHVSFQKQDHSLEMAMRQIGILKKQWQLREKNELIKAREDIWNKRMMKSKAFDSQIIIKHKQFSTSMLICLFIFVFSILFHLIPTQAYYPPLG